MIAAAVAHPNIALVKYWGKRDAALNLPAAGSLSLTLGPIATRTRVEFAGRPGADRFVLNGREETGAGAAKLSRFIDLVREHAPDAGAVTVESTNDFPTAAGLASSSSGFAALALAATRAAGVEVTDAALSVLARRGSGSAARSVFGGFVRMHAGTLPSGDDAFAEPMEALPMWSDLRCVIAVTREGAKDTPSTEGMNRTERTSPYFAPWVQTVEPAVVRAMEALRAGDFGTLADVAEASALQMHASAMAAVPGVIYFHGATIDVVHAVRRWRGEGLDAFFTIDAGPHVKVFVREGQRAELVAALAGVPGVLRTIETVPAGPARCVDPAAWQEAE